MRNYIILNGKNSNEINGLLIQELPPISKPQIRTEIEEIDGRDGDIVTKLGFAAYDKEISVGLYKDFDINEIIAYFNSEGTIVFSNEPDKYYNYQIIDQIDFERLVRYRTATIRMHCQPFKYSTTQGTITKDASATVSDEGSNLVLENTAEAPFKKLEPKGNAEQKTLSGKNLSNIYTIPNQIAANLKVNVADEKITISDNANAIGYTNTTIKLSVLCPTLQVGDTVYLFFDTTSSSTQKDNIYIQGTGANIYWAKATSKTITQAMLDANIILYGGHDETAVISNFMITKTNDATYEPYCGGIPSPNPNYPQDVETVSGAQTVKITGKNLLDISNINTSYGANGLTTTANSDGSLSWSGTATATWAILVNYTMVNLEAGTYTLSIDKALGYRFYIEAMLEDNTTVNMIIEAGQTSKTSTFAKNIKQIRINLSYLGNGQTYDETVKAQFELGSQATAYEPYQAQSCLLDLVLGKNRFSGNFSQFNNRRGNGNTYAYFKLPDNDEYILSLKAKNNVPAQSQQVFIGFSADGGQSAGGVRWVWTNSTTASAGDVKYANNLPSGAGENMHFVSLYAPTKATLQWFVENFYIQLEKGTSPTDYEAYNTLELAAIGDYADEPVKVDGTWYIRRAIGKVVFDGSNDEGWWLQSGTTNQMRAPISGTLAGAPLMSDYFHNSSSESELGAMQIYLAGYLRAISNQTSANDFKTWLSTHPTTVYYALATPTDEEITDSELIEQLEALAEAHSYKGHTHITATAADGNAPAVLSVEVGEDNESTVTNSGNINSKPVIKIYGSGNIGAYLNDIQILQIALGDEGYITIDTNLMEAYKDTLDNLKNRLVTGDYSKFSLKPGANKIHFSGTVTKYEISKYSRWL